MEKAAVDTILGAVDRPTPALAPLTLPTSPSVAAVKTGFTLYNFPGARARDHVFHDLGSFAAFLTRLASNKAGEVEILVEDTKVVALTDPTNPNGDRLTCELVEHPTFAAWKALFSKTLQRDFHQKLRGLVSTISDQTLGKVLFEGAQKVKAATGADVESELDERGYWRVTGETNRTEVSTPIPSIFKILTPLYLGVTTLAADVPIEVQNPPRECSYDLEVLLSMSLNPVAFELTCPGLPAVKHQARLDVLACLQRLLGASFLVGLGKLVQREVAGAAVALE